IISQRIICGRNSQTDGVPFPLFTGAQTPMQVNPGDVLFTYVWMDPSAKPDQIMLQWNDGISWEHRAFWGENYIGRQVTNIGAQGTESQRYVGGLPPAGSW